MSLALSSMLPAIAAWYAHHGWYLGMGGALTLGTVAVPTLRAWGLRPRAAVPMPGAERRQASPVPRPSPAVTIPDPEPATRPWLPPPTPEPGIPLRATLLPAARTRPAGHSRSADSRRWRRYHEHLDLQRYCTVAQGLSDQYRELAADPAFFASYISLLQRQLRRPTPVLGAAGLAPLRGHRNLLLKREDLREAGEAQLMNAYAQVLVARLLGKRQVVAAMHSVAAGQAVARAASALGMACQLYVDPDASAELASAIQAERSLGGATLTVISEHDEHDCRRAAMSAWMQEPQACMFVSDISGGPTPHQRMALDCQAVIGQEILSQCGGLRASQVGAVYAPESAHMAAFGFLNPFLGQPDTARYLCHGERHRPAAFAREHDSLALSGGACYLRVDDARARAMQERLAQEEGLEVGVDDARAIVVATAQAPLLPSGTAAVVLLAPATAPANPR